MFHDFTTLYRSSLKHPRRRFQRAIAVALSGAYLFTQVAAGHAGEANFWSQRRQAVQGQTQKPFPAQGRTASDPVNLQLAQLTSPPLGVGSWNSPENGLPFSNKIPPSAASSSLPWMRELPVWVGARGEVRKIHMASRPQAPLVIHIQDAHEVEEAQKNIADVLLNLKWDSLVVGLEGASGAFELGPYRRIPDPGVRRGLAELFMKQGYLGGAEMAAVVSEKEVPLWGVENAALYEANVKSLRAASSQKNRMEAALKPLDHALRDLKNQVDSPALAEFYKRTDALRAGQEKWGGHVLYLADRIRAWPASLENTKLLVDALRRETALDFPTVEKERLAMAKALARALSPARLEILTRESLRLRDGGLTVQAYNQLLQKFCQESGLSLAIFPAMAGYMEYTAAVEKIDRGALLTEFDALEDAAHMSLAARPEHHQIWRAQKDCLLLHNLTGQRMTPHDWSAYQSRRSEILRLPERLAALKESKAAGKRLSPPISLDLVSPFESFCRLALQRNQALVGNLLSHMKEKNISQGVLVAGGFHTDGLTRILETNDVSYIVITPRLTQAPKDVNSAFTRDPLPLEKLLSGEPISLLSQRLTTAVPSADPAFALQRAGLEGQWAAAGPALGGQRRMENGVSVEQAEKEMEALAQELARELPTLDDALLESMNTDVRRKGFHTVTQWLLRPEGQEPVRLKLALTRRDMMDRARNFFRESGLSDRGLLQETSAHVEGVEYALLLYRSTGARNMLQGTAEELRAWLKSLQAAAGSESSFHPAPTGAGVEDSAMGEPPQDGPPLALAGNGSGGYTPRKWFPMSSDSYLDFIARVCIVGLATFWFPVGLGLDTAMGQPLVWGTVILVGLLFTLQIYLGFASLRKQWDHAGRSPFVFLALAVVSMNLFMALFIFPNHQVIFPHDLTHWQSTGALFVLSWLKIQGTSLFIISLSLVALLLSDIYNRRTDRLKADFKYFLAPVNILMGWRRAMNRMAVNPAARGGNVPRRQMIGWGILGLLMIAAGYKGLESSSLTKQKFSRDPLTVVKVIAGHDLKAILETQLKVMTGILTGDSSVATFPISIFDPKNHRMTKITQHAGGSWSVCVATLNPFPPDMTGPVRNFEVKVQGANFNPVNSESLNRERLVMYSKDQQYSADTWIFQNFPQEETADAVWMLDELDKTAKSLGAEEAKTVRVAQADFIRALWSRGVPLEVKSREAIPLDGRKWQISMGRNKQNGWTIQITDQQSRDNIQLVQSGNGKGLPAMEVRRNVLWGVGQTTLLILSANPFPEFDPLVYLSVKNLFFGSYATALKNRLEDSWRLEYLRQMFSELDFQTILLQQAIGQVPRQIHFFTLGTDQDTTWIVLRKDGTLRVIKPYAAARNLEILMVNPRQGEVRHEGILLRPLENSGDMITWNNARENLLRRIPTLIHSGLDYFDGLRHLKNYLETDPHVLFEPSWALAIRSLLLGAGGAGPGQRPTLEMTGREKNVQPTGKFIEVTRYEGVGPSLGRKLVEVIVAANANGYSSQGFLWNPLEQVILRTGTKHNNQGQPVTVITSGLYPRDAGRHNLFQYLTGLALMWNGLQVTSGGGTMLPGSLQSEIETAFQKALEQEPVSQPLTVKNLRLPEYPFPVDIEITETVSGLLVLQLAVQGRRFLTTVLQDDPKSPGGRALLLWGPFKSDSPFERVVTYMEQGSSRQFVTGARTALQSNADLLNGALIQVLDRTQKDRLKQAADRFSRAQEESDSAETSVPETINVFPPAKLSVNDPSLVQMRGVLHRNTPLSARNNPESLIFELANRTVIVTRYPHSAQELVEIIFNELGLFKGYLLDARRHTTTHAEVAPFQEPRAVDMAITPSNPHLRAMSEILNAIAQDGSTHERLAPVWKILNSFIQPPGESRRGNQTMAPQEGGPPQRLFNAFQSHFETLDEKKKTAGLTTWETVLWNLFHPLRGAPFLETLGLIAATLAWKTFFQMGVFDDPMGFSAAAWLGAFVLAALFSLAHPDLYGTHIYEGADLDEMVRVRLTARARVFMQRWAGGMVFILPAMIFSPLAGLLLSWAMVHLPLNVGLIVSRSSTWAASRPELKKWLLPFSIFNSLRISRSLLLLGLTATGTFLSSMVKPMVMTGIVLLITLGTGWVFSTLGLSGIPEFIQWSAIMLILSIPFVPLETLARDFLDRGLPRSRKRNILESALIGLLTFFGSILLYDKPLAALDIFNGVEQTTMLPLFTGMTFILMWLWNVSVRLKEGWKRYPERSPAHLLTPIVAEYAPTEFHPGARQRFEVKPPHLENDKKNIALLDMVERHDTLIDIEHTLFTTTSEAVFRAALELSQFIRTEFAEEIPDIRLNFPLDPPTLEFVNKLSSAQFRRAAQALSGVKGLRITKNHREVLTRSLAFAPYWRILAHFDRRGKFGGLPYNEARPLFETLISQRSDGRRAILADLLFLAAEQKRKGLDPGILNPHILANIVKNWKPYETDINGLAQLAQAVKDRALPGFYLDPAVLKWLSLKSHFTATLNQLMALGRADFEINQAEAFLTRNVLKRIIAEPNAEMEFALLQTLLQRGLATRATAPKVEEFFMRGWRPGMRERVWDLMKILAQKNLIRADDFEDALLFFKALSGFSANHQRSLLDALEDPEVLECGAFWKFNLLKLSAEEESTVVSYVSLLKTLALSGHLGGQDAPAVQKLFGALKNLRKKNDSTLEYLGFANLYNLLSHYPSLISDFSLAYLTDLAPTPRLYKIIDMCLDRQEPIEKIKTLLSQARAFPSHQMHLLGTELEKALAKPFITLDFLLAVMEGKEEGTYMSLPDLMGPADMTADVVADLTLAIQIINTHRSTLVSEIPYPVAGYAMAFRDKASAGVSVLSPLHLLREIYGDFLPRDVMVRAFLPSHLREGLRGQPIPNLRTLSAQGIFDGKAIDETTAAWIYARLRSDVPSSAALDFDEFLAILRDPDHGSFQKPLIYRFLERWGLREGGELTEQEQRLIIGLSVIVLRDVVNELASPHAAPITMRELVRFNVDFSRFYSQLDAETDTRAKFQRAMAFFVVTAHNVYGRAIHDSASKKQFIQILLRCLLARRYSALFGMAFSEDAAERDMAQEVERLMDYADYENLAEIELVDIPPLRANLAAKVGRAFQVMSPLLLKFDDDNSVFVEEMIRNLSKEDDTRVVRVSVSAFTRRQELFGMYMPRENMDEAEVDRLIAQAPREDLGRALAAVQGLAADQTANILAIWDGDSFVREDAAMRQSLAAYLKNPEAWEEFMEWRDGIQGKLAREAHRHPDRRYVLVYDNIDACPDRVRVQLNPVLWEKMVEDTEKGERLILPGNFHTLFTMHRRGVIKDDAFMNRPLVHSVDSVTDADMERLLLEKGLANESVNTLLRIYQTIRVEKWRERVDFSFHDLLEIGARVRGRARDEHTAERSVLAQEAYDYIFLRLRSLEDKQRLKKIPFFEKVRKPAVIIRGRELIFEGVSLPAAPAFVAFARANRGKPLGTLVLEFSQTGSRGQGFVITDLETRVLCQMARALKYGNRTLQLEGPSGEGKTEMGRIFARLIAFHLREKTINQETDLTDFRGYLRPTRDGRYVFQEAAYVTHVQGPGNVFLLNEINTNRHDGLYDWHLAEATGREEKDLTEYATGDESLVKTARIDQNNLWLYTVNPGRQLSPARLSSSFPRFYIAQDPADLHQTILGMFRSKKIQSRRAEAAALARIHSAIQEAARRGKIRSPQVVTRRELLQARDLFAEGLAQGLPPARAFHRAVTQTYLFMWVHPEDRAEVRKILPGPPQGFWENLTNVFDSRVTAVQERGLAWAALDDLLAKDRPVLALFNAAVDPQEILQRARNANPGADVRQVPLSYFHGKRQFVGGLTPTSTAKGRIHRAWATNLEVGLGCLPAMIKDARFNAGRTLVAVFSNYTHLNPKVAPLLNEFWQTGRLEAVQELITPEVARELCDEIMNRGGPWPALRAEYERDRGEALPWRVEALDAAQRRKFAQWFYSTAPPNLKSVATGSSQEKLYLSQPEVNRFVSVNLAEAMDQRWIENYIQQRLPAGLASYGGLIKRLATEAHGLYEEQARRREYEHNRLGRSDIDVFLRELADQPRLDAIAIRKIAFYIFGAGLRDAYRLRLSYLPETLQDPAAAIRYETSADGVHLWVDGLRFKTFLAGAPGPDVEFLAPTETLVRQLASMLLGVKHGRLILSEGFPGGGKTVSFQELAMRLGLAPLRNPPYKTQMYEDIDLGEFLGRISKRGREFLLTSEKDAAGRYKLDFLRVYAEGGVYLFDEGAIGVNSQEVLSFIALILQQEELDLGLFHPGLSGEVIRRHPQAVFGVSQNPAKTTRAREPTPYQVDIAAQKIWADNRLSEKDALLIINFYLKAAADRVPLDLRERLARLHVVMCENHPNREELSPRQLINVVRHINKALQEEREVSRGLWLGVMTTYLAGLDEKEFDALWNHVKAVMGRTTLGVLEAWERPVQVRRVNDTLWIDGLQIPASAASGNLSAHDIWLTDDLPSHNRTMREIAAKFSIRSPVALMEEEGADALDLLRKLVRKMNGDLHVFWSHPQMTRMHLTSSFLPLFEETMNRQGVRREHISGRFRAAAGFLLQHMVLEGKTEPAFTARPPQVLFFHLMDSIPERQRVLLNEILTTRRFPLTDEAGVTRTYVLPQDVQIVVSSPREHKFASAFINRFDRPLLVRPVTALDELETVIHARYSLVRDEEIRWLRELALGVHAYEKPAGALGITALGMPGRNSSAGFSHRYGFGPRDILKLARLIHLDKQKDLQRERFHTHPAYYAVKAAWILYGLALEERDLEIFEKSILNEFLGGVIYGQPLLSRDWLDKELGEMKERIFEELSAVETMALPITVPTAELTTGQFLTLDNGITVRRDREGYTIRTPGNVYAVKDDQLNDWVRPHEGAGLRLKRDKGQLILELGIVHGLGGMVLPRDPLNLSLALPESEIATPEYVKHTQEIRRLFSLLLRAWERVQEPNGWVHLPRVMFLNGKTGGAKTTGIRNAARLWGVPLYILNAHHDLKVSDPTVSLRMKKGKFEVGIREFLARCGKVAVVSDGHRIVVNDGRIDIGSQTSSRAMLLIDEGNASPDLLYALMPLMRGEKKFTMHYAGDVYEVELDTEVMLVLTFNPAEEYEGRRDFPREILAYGEKAWPFNPLDYPDDILIDEIMPEYHRRGFTTRVRDLLLGFGTAQRMSAGHADVPSVTTVIERLAHPLVREAAPLSGIYENAGETQDARPEPAPPQQGQAQPQAAPPRPSRTIAVKIDFDVNKIRRAAEQFDAAKGYRFFAEYVLEDFMKAVGHGHGEILREAVLTAAGRLDPRFMDLLARFLDLYDRPQILKSDLRKFFIDLHGFLLPQGVYLFAKLLNFNTTPYLLVTPEEIVDRLDFPIHGYEKLDLNRADHGLPPPQVFVLDGSRRFPEGNAPGFTDGEHVVVFRNFRPMAGVPQDISTLWRAWHEMGHLFDRRRFQKDGTEPVNTEINAFLFTLIFSPSPKIHLQRFLLPLLRKTRDKDDVYCQAVKGILNGFLILRQDQKDTVTPPDLITNDFEEPLLKEAEKFVRGLGDETVSEMASLFYREPGRYLSTAEKGAYQLIMTEIGLEELTPGNGSSLMVQLDMDIDVKVDAPKRLGDGPELVDDENPQGEMDDEEDSPTPTGPGSEKEEPSNAGGAGSDRESQDASQGQQGAAGGAGTNGQSPASQGTGKGKIGQSQEMGIIRPPDPSQHKELEELESIAPQVIADFFQIFAGTPKTGMRYSDEGPELDILRVASGDPDPFYMVELIKGLAEATLGLLVDVSGSTGKFVPGSDSLRTTFTMMARFYSALFFHAGKNNKEVEFSLGAVGDFYHPLLDVADSHNREAIERALAALTRLDDNGGINTVSVIKGLWEKYKNYPGHRNRLEFIFTDGRETFSAVNMDELQKEMVGHYGPAHPLSRIFELPKNAKHTDHMARLRHAVDLMESEFDVDTVFVGINTPDVKEYPRYLIFNKHPGQHELILAILELSLLKVHLGRLPEGNLADYIPSLQADNSPSASMLWYKNKHYPSISLRTYQRFIAWKEESALTLKSAAILSFPVFFFFSLDASILFFQALVGVIFFGGHLLDFFSPATRSQAWRNLPAAGFVVLLSQWPVLLLGLSPVALALSVASFYVAHWALNEFSLAAADLAGVLSGGPAEPKTGPFLKIEVDADDIRTRVIQRRKTLGELRDKLNKHFKPDSDQAWEARLTAFGRNGDVLALQDGETPRESQEQVLRSYLRYVLRPASASAALVRLAALHQLGETLVDMCWLESLMARFDIEARTVQEKRAADVMITFMLLSQDNHDQDHWARQVELGVRAYHQTFGFKNEWAYRRWAMEEERCAGFELPASILFGAEAESLSESDRKVLRHLEQWANVTETRTPIPLLVPDGSGAHAAAHLSRLLPGLARHGARFVVIQQSQIREGGKLSRRLLRALLEQKGWAAGQSLDLFVLNRAQWSDAGDPALRLLLLLTEDMVYDATDAAVEEIHNLVLLQIMA